MKRSMLFVSLLASVAACSSGGSSDPSPGAAATTAPATSSSSGSGTTANADPAFTYSATTGTQSRQALNTGADYGAPPPSSVNGLSASNTVTLGNDPTSGDPTVTLNLTNPDGSTVSHAFDMSTATTYTATNPNPGGVSASFSEVNQTDYDLKIDGAASGDLNYVSYGLWNAPEGTSGGFGVFAAGQPTSSAAMASLASAGTVLNYAGQVIGQGTLGCGGTAGCGGYTVSGTFNQTINYGNGNVTGGLTLNADGGAGITALGSGTMTGNMDAGGASTYTLSNINVGTNAALAPTGLTGTGKGFVAGSGANETAFTATMSDSATGGMNGIGIAAGGAKH